MKNIWRTAAVVLLAAGLVAGCSQDKPPAPPTPTPAPTAAAAPALATTATAATAAATAAPPKTPPVTATRGAAPPQEHAPGSTAAAASPPAAQYGTDDSFCRWSVKLYSVLSAGSDEGEELIAPVPGAAASDRR